ncbi:MAG: ATP-binding protein [Pseudomonadota bacterium]|nr:ATP-binding protein [Pseudomonadota bacterium]
MNPRFAQRRLAELLSQFPAVVLIGPRQAGKTTLALAEMARHGDALYLDLELPSAQRQLDDPEAFLLARRNRLVILDEVQRLPELFAILRGVIDLRRRDGEAAGQFLLLGSASGVLLQQAGESLAGRVAQLELTPFQAREILSPNRPAADLDSLWVRGGFPLSWLAPDETASLRWRDAFIATYLERDIPALAACRTLVVDSENRPRRGQFLADSPPHSPAMGQEAGEKWTAAVDLQPAIPKSGRLLGPRIPATTLRRLWTMLAHSQGGLLNQSQLAASLAISGQTVARYIDLLCDLMLVRRLPAWHGNVGKRLVRAPKVYVRDSGIVHALLGLADLESVLSHPIAGASWEGFVIEQLLAAYPETEASFYRTAHGAEADLVLAFRNGETWVVEIKRASAPTVSKGFHLAAADVGATRKLLVAPVAEAYPMRDGIEVMNPLAASGMAGQ